MSNPKKKKHSSTLKKLRVGKVENVAKVGNVGKINKIKIRNVGKSLSCPFYTIECPPKTFVIQKSSHESQVLLKN